MAYYEVTWVNGEIVIKSTYYTFLKKNACAPLQPAKLNITNGFCCH